MPRASVSRARPVAAWLGTERSRCGATDPAQSPAHRISIPTAYVWGRDDPALGRAAAERTRDHVAADYTFIELDAGHWLPETRAREVAAAILERRRTLPQ